MFIIVNQLIVLYGISWLSKYYSLLHMHYIKITMKYDVFDKAARQATQRGDPV